MKTQLYKVGWIARLIFRERIRIARHSFDEMTCSEHKRLLSSTFIVTCKKRDMIELDFYLTYKAG